MSSITIPVGIARVMTKSAWWARNHGVIEGDPDSTNALVMYHLQRATEGGYKRNVGSYSAEQAQTLIDLLGVVRAEEQLKPADVATFEKFIDEMGRYLDRKILVEKRLAEEEAAKNAEHAADFRRFETEQRERQLAVLVEHRRAVILRQISEDYGLSLQDPQVRAGLIAAFHAGARVMQSTTMELVFDQGPRTWDEEKWEQYRERDKVTFAKARDLAKQAKAGESNDRGESETVVSTSQ